jgi:(2R)-ethylmalonyl-CoA mutase
VSGGGVRGGRAAWRLRTYSGRTSAAAANALYRNSLLKGDTVLSVAFDRPTQLGWDADHALARGEVGRAGVPVSSIADVRTLFEGVPLARTDTSLTVNTAAAWLLSLVVAVAEEQRADPATLTGTTQNDVVDDLLLHGALVFPPGPSLRLAADLVVHAVRHLPRWVPVNLCAARLQDAGATPAQQVARTLANAAALLDTVRASGQVTEREMGLATARVSFLWGAGTRLVEEVAKLRAFAALWDGLCRDRYGIGDPAQRRFRYDLQIDPPALADAQRHRNSAPILLEMLVATLSSSVRARALQVPAWNEALGLPRPWDHRRAQRTHEFLVEQTDLPAHGDILAGSHVVEALTADLVEEARAEYRRVTQAGGALATVGPLRAGLARAYQPAGPVGADEGFLSVDPDNEDKQIARLEAFRASRDQAEVERALYALQVVAASEVNLLPASIAAARAGVTTGEWTGALREVFGAADPGDGLVPYRTPTISTAGTAT